MPICNSEIETQHRGGMGVKEQERDLRIGIGGGGHVYVRMLLPQSELVIESGVFTCMFLGTIFDDVWRVQLRWPHDSLPEGTRFRQRR